ASVGIAPADERGQRKALRKTVHTQCSVLARLGMQIRHDDGDRAVTDECIQASPGVGPEQTMLTGRVHQRTAIGIIRKKRCDERHANVRTSRVHNAPPHGSVERRPAPGIVRLPARVALAPPGRTAIYDRRCQSATSFSSQRYLPASTSCASRYAKRSWFRNV